MAYQKESKENKSAKRIRVTMAVLLFIEVVLTSFPFLQDLETGESYSPFGVLIQTISEPTSERISAAIAYGLFVLLPMIAFFFCVLDSKSNAKNFISAAVCVICVIMIISFIGPAHIAFGSVMSLLLYIAIMFFSTMGFFASIKK
ncbi:MAG: hypothetical protein IJJ15_07520 [Ruminococcus sp.]|nr:hypothetical protein [Ruminococcus sp.]